ncbi:MULTISPECIES: NAD(P)-binding protein [Mycobacteriaceae]|uniref:FAD-dependent monooxygenase n=1 Tax=Mycolicibacterium parafortuitum TaxID=39692 RepID=A0ACC6MBG0_MYCPF|nr:MULTISPECIES: NAD(P)-binding protein [Mycobacteriaceae]MDZ5084250.1 FAD-dependent monooxygenase [Mycolicibacterium parafortuitum]GFM20492.1 monooxygenase FAD-binding protein [Mycobacterium sp. PO1]GFM22618.1 monooxygenase FAD-binding protein [Mycobacterium sp. PO2]
MTDTGRQHWAGHRAVVIGGSIGGLTAALLLRKLGFDVDVYERTPTDLDGRGGGIVLQPDTLRWFVECSEQHPENVSTATHFVQYLGSENEVVYREAAPWRYTSWGTFYRALLADFGTERYHLGEYASGFDQDADGVEVRFASGRIERAELVVFADGITSASRRRISPDSELEYSGYVGWRGTVPEREVSPATFELLRDSISYSFGLHTHINVYPIPSPSGGLSVGERLLNYVWYRNVAEGYELDELMTDKRGFVAGVSLHPGQVQDRFVDEMRSAASNVLAPAAAEVVLRTEQPYLQAVYDVGVQQMATGRVALIGDAASAARPHAAAGTAKAAANAWALHDALADSSDIAEALAKWEPGQLELGQRLLRRVKEMGTRSQVTCTWVPGDPDNRFGLYGPGH